MRFVLQMSLCAALFLPSVSSALAQQITQPEEDTAAKVKDAFRASIRLGQKSILPYEPLTAVVDFRNISEQTQTARTRWWRGVFVRRGEAGEWIPAIRGGGPLFSPPSPGQLSFKPGQGETFTWRMDLNQKCEHLFAQPGTYWIKAIYAIWESDPVRLEVQPAPPQEAEALKVLVQNELFQYFLNGQPAACKMEQPQPQKAVPLLRVVTENFPRTRYGQWSNLGALLIERNAAEADRNNRPRLRAAHDALAALAPTLLPPLNAFAWFEAGLTAQSLEDDDAADIDFQRAVDTQAVFGLEEQVREFRRTYRSKGPEGFEFFEKTRKELEAAGYDVQNFSKNYPEVYKEFVLAQKPTIRMYGSGKISLAEYYRQVSELLRKYMTERTKPTLKPK